MIPLRFGPHRGRALVALLLLPASFGTAAPTSAATESPLWREAVSIAGRSAEYLPGSIYSSVTVTDARGNVKNFQQTWSRLSVGKGGAIVTTVVRSLKDGRDNTADAQRELDRNPQRGRFDSSFLPMLPVNQSRVDVAPTGQTRILDGIRCAGFSFRMRGERTTEGTVWLDERSGAPLLLEFTFVPLPPGASVVRNTLRFAVSPHGMWHLDSLETYAEGRLLFFERVFRLHMEFSDYFPYSPADKPGASQ